MMRYSGGPDGEGTGSRILYSVAQLPKPNQSAAPAPLARLVQVFSNFYTYFTFTQLPRWPLCTPQFPLRHLSSENHYKKAFNFFTLRYFLVLLGYAFMALLLHCRCNGLNRISRASSHTCASIIQHYSNEEHYIIYLLQISIHF